MTVACQLKMSGNPMSMNHCPTPVFFPNASSSRKPHTVGGSTMGMVKMESAMSCARAGMRRLKYAAASPKMKMNTMAVSVVLSVTHKGLKSMPPRNSASAAKPVAAPTTSTLSAGAIVAKSAWVGRT